MKIKIVAPGVELFIIVLASFMKLDDNLVHKHRSSSQTLTSRYHTINCVQHKLSKIKFFDNFFSCLSKQELGQKNLLVGRDNLSSRHYTACQHQLPS